MWLVIDLLDDLLEHEKREEQLIELHALRDGAMDFLFRWRKLFPFPH